jgi:uncharacterized membrane protein (DUF485 family)
VSRRAWAWIGGLAGADLVVWLVTLHAQAGFHSNAGAVSSLGIVLGWIIAVGLFVILVLVAIGVRNARRRQR